MGFSPLASRRPNPNGLPLLALAWLCVFQAPAIRPAKGQENGALPSGVASAPSTLRDSQGMLRDASTVRAAPLPATNQPSLGDAAWITGSPPPRLDNQAALAEAPRPPASMGMRHAGQSLESKVMPAQFNKEHSPDNHLSTSRVSTGANAASTTSPRPLKPPTDPNAQAAGQRPSSTLQMFISVASSLAIVIGLILGAAWCYRKAAPAVTGALPKQVVHILGRTQLAARQQLVLVRFGSKLVLVSNLQGEVRTISEITDPVEVDEIAGLCESAQPGSISESFRSVLHNMGRNGS